MLNKQKRIKKPVGNFHSSKKADCPFCFKNLTIASVIDYSENWVLTYSDEVSKQKYLKLSTRKHLENLSKLSNAAWAELGEFLKRAIKKQKKLKNYRKTYLLLISEKVPHIHFHVLAQTKADPQGLQHLKNHI